MYGGVRQLFKESVQVGLPGWIIAYCNFFAHSASISEITDHYLRADRVAAVCRDPAEYTDHSQIWQIQNDFNR